MSLHDEISRLKAENERLRGVLKAAINILETLRWDRAPRHSLGTIEKEFWDDKDRIAHAVVRKGRAALSGKEGE